MKFTKKQKKIVEDIKERRVYDITSFLKVYGYTKEFKYDKTSIEAEFNEMEQGKTYKVLKPGRSPINFSFSFTIGKIQNHEKRFNDDDFEFKKATIDYSKFDKRRTAYDTDFTFNLLQSNIISTGFSDIFNFLVVWQYLKENGLILEVVKQVKNDDISVFYSEVNKGDKVSHNSNLSSKKLASLPSVNGKTIDNIILKKEIQNINFISEPPKRDAMDFVSTTLEFNEESFKVCESKIQYKIIPTPELYYFTQRKLKTEAETFNRNSLIAAWTAILITLIFSMVSLGFDIVSYNNSNEDTTKHYENINILKGKLEDINNNIIEQQRLLLWEDHIENSLKEQSKINESIEGISSEVLKLSNIVQQYILELESDSKENQ